MENKLLNRLGTGFRWFLIIGGLILLGLFINSRWQEVQTYRFSFDPIPFLGGLVALLLFYGLYSQSWIRILIWLSTDPVPVGSIRLSRIFFASFITRYLPAGKLFNIGTRIELLNRAGVNRLLGASSLFVEQVFFIGATLILTWIAFLHSPESLLSADFSLLYYLVLPAGLLILAVMLLGPDKIIRYLGNRFGWRFGLIEEEINLFQRIEIFIRFLVVNFLQGFAITLILWSIYPALTSRSLSIFWLFAAYPIGRLVGQLASVMPGGIGIREGMYVLLLSPYVPVQALLIASAIMRFVSVLMEFVILIGLSIAIRIQETKGSAFHSPGD
jgi:hypothetical protein